MVKPLSISGYKRFLRCPKYYYYNDIAKLRPTSKSSALFFGTILDDVINDILLKKSKDHKKELLEKIELIGDTTQFFANDFDPELLTMEDVEELTAFAKSIGWKGDDFIPMVKTMMADQTSLSDNQYVVLHKTVWRCLYRKGIVMINSYIEKVIPRIKRVIDVQIAVEFKDDKASFRGYADLACEWEDGSIILFDNKTTSMPYSQEMVQRSAQLALYAQILGYDKVGFIAINKQISKGRKKICSECGYDGSGTRFATCNNKVGKARCGAEWDTTINPSSWIQIFIDKMPKRIKDLTMDAMYDTVKAIDNKVYPRNLDKCFNMFGKPCPYVNKCWKGSNKGLKNE